MIKFSNSCAVQTRSRYAPAVAAGHRALEDNILAYLKEPLVSTAAIKEAGGYVSYWNTASTSRVRVSRMGTDFCSAPGEAHSETLYSIY